jgi:predicted RNA methylase
MKVKKPKLGNTRVTGKEQYYTPANLSLEIIQRVCKDLEDPTSRVFLEPAGGTGSFIEAAKVFGFKSIESMDIEPKHPLVKLEDFLEANLKLSNAVCVSNHALSFWIGTTNHYVPVRSHSRGKK